MWSSYIWVGRVDQFVSQNSEVRPIIYKNPRSNCFIIIWVWKVEDISKSIRNDHSLKNCSWKSDELSQWSMSLIEWQAFISVPVCFQIWNGRALHFFVKCSVGLVDRIGRFHDCWDRIFFHSRAWKSVVYHFPSFSCFRWSLDRVSCI